MHPPTVHHDAGNGVLVPPEAVDFDALYRREQPRIYHQVLRIVGDPDDAHDLTHEAFLRAWQHRDRIDPDQNPGGWVFTIARNLTLRRLQRERVLAFEPWERDVPRPAQVVHETPEQTALRTEARELVHRVLPLLAERFRVVLVLRYGHGLTQDAIGDQIGARRSSAGATLHRARQAFARVAATFDGGAGAPPVVLRSTDRAGLERLVEALHAAVARRGRLPGRTYVCRATGLSEAAYARLMGVLTTRGCIVGRSDRQTGRLTHATAEETLAAIGAAS